MLRDGIKPFNIGDKVTTDFVQGKITMVEIVDKRLCKNCQSGILYRVNPPLIKGMTGNWIDHAWFKKVGE